MWVYTINILVFLLHYCQIVSVIFRVFVSVEQVANEFGLSRSHLHRKMKELTGESTRDSIRNIRLKRAAYLLEDGRHSIAEVMYACGFDSPSDFSTRFKNFYGVSPSEYMKEHSCGEVPISERGNK